MTVPPDRARGAEPRTLNHFAVLRLTAAWWRLERADRCRRLRALQEALAGVADVLHLYQMFPLHDTGDLLAWTALRSAEPERVHAYFGGYARALAPLRPLLEVRQPLWGFTRPSTYTKTRSTQEIDPFTAERKRHLVVYPFVKTSAWYGLSRDVRQGMMNGHIRVGKGYPDVTQLLLYSVGVQDQEFVVVYETDDLTRFSDLVNQLRGTEARAYTERDTPLTTALHHAGSETLELFC